MKQKTVHAIVKYFYPVAAGIETNMMETYKVFVEKGWKVIVHTSTNTLTEKNILKSEEVINGIEVKRYQWNISGFYPNISWNDASVIALHNFNIVPHFQILLNIILRRVKHQNVPVVLLTPHGGFTPDWEIFNPLTAIIKKIYHYTIGTVIINHSVDIIRAVSEWEKIEIISHGINPSIVTTISNGVEDEAFVDVDKLASKEVKKLVDSFGTYILQIGRIYNIKNNETVIHALSKLPKHINYVMVGPIGDEQYLQMLQRLIKELGLEKRVFFAGIIRGVDKYYVIKHAELMVHMARWESFCNAVHEGMSQGLVCVVADNTALPLLIKNGVNGYCLDAYDIDKLVVTLSDVIANKRSPRIRDMIQKNRAFGLQESWHAVGLSISDLLNKRVNITHKS